MRKHLQSGLHQRFFVSTSFICRVRFDGSVKANKRKTIKKEKKNKQGKKERKNKKKERKREGERKTKH